MASCPRPSLLHVPNLQARSGVQVVQQRRGRASRKAGWLGILAAACRAAIFRSWRVFWRSRTSSMRCARSGPYRDALPLEKVFSIMRKDSPQALDLPCLEALISAAKIATCKTLEKPRGIFMRSSGMNLRSRLTLFSSALLLAAAGAHGQDFFTNAAECARPRWAARMSCLRRHDRRAVGESGGLDVSARRKFKPRSRCVYPARIVFEFGEQRRAAEVGHRRGALRRVRHADRAFAVQLRRRIAAGIGVRAAIGNMSMLRALRERHMDCSKINRRS